METETPKQKTPKGTEIPVPMRKEFYGNLDKVVKAPARPADKKGG
jgi:hypothetical protein